MGYGLGPATNAAFDGGGEKRGISIIGDGGFWHNGLSRRSATWSTIALMRLLWLWTTIIRQQLAGRTCCRRASNATKATNNPIADAVKGIVKWLFKLTHL